MIKFFLCCKDKNEETVPKISTKKQVKFVDVEIDYSFNCQEKNLKQI